MIRINYHPHRLLVSGGSCDSVPIADALELVESEVTVLSPTIEQIADSPAESVYEGAEQKSAPGDLIDREPQLPQPKNPARN